MLFKKKRSTNFGRSRQPQLRGSGTAKPVFSYHARAMRSAEPTSDAKRSTKLLWTNPTQPMARHTRPRPPKRLLVLIVLAVALVFGINSLFLGRDPKTVVVGTAASHPLLRSQDTYTAAARDILASSLFNTTKVTINTEQVAQTIQDRFPELQRVSVVLPIFGRQPVVYLEPIQPALLLRSGEGRVYVLDQSGRAVMDVAQASSVAKLALPVVEDQSGLPITLGHTVLPRANMTFITEVLGQLTAKKIKVSAITLPVGASELDIRVEGVPYVTKYNLHGDARAEVGAFLATKQYLEAQHKTPALYIDVRVDNKVYYK